MSDQALAKARHLVYAVDDERLHLDLMARSLSDYEVVSFEQPAALVAAARRRSPVVVLADYRMPTLNGVELIEALRDSGVSCPVILVTAFSDVEDVARAK